jgi:hypothetical protein
MLLLKSLSMPRRLLQKKLPQKMKPQRKNLL